MKQYVLTIYQPDGPPPGPEVLEPIARDLAALEEELRAAGAWVFSGALLPPGQAAVVRVRGGDLLTVDGPYTEGKEHIGGFTVIRAPDRDAALAWAAKLAKAVRLLPIEVREFHG
ncbi:hypothetical protein E1286_41650 [Nonomuraea terrae]|uniref:YCII-related domain-containing protein n=1 Tax=Nonomuraea terrae TaxID=2530383 RepID=A0A4R4XTD7_9ACTN|nr:YciI family protein [Nonomuraea terrae]TDD33852.1 hypothetical protein E1286_41650 [Nonomuraea terrae]